MPVGGKAKPGEKIISVMLEHPYYAHRYAGIGSQSSRYAKQDNGARSREHFVAYPQHT